MKMRLKNKLFMTQKFYKLMTLHRAKIIFIRDLKLQWDLGLQCNISRQTRKTKEILKTSHLKKKIWFQWGTLYSEQTYKEERVEKKESNFQSSSIKPIAIHFQESINPKYQTPQMTQQETFNQTTLSVSKFLQWWQQLNLFRKKTQ